MIITKTNIPKTNRNDVSNKNLTSGSSGGGGIVYIYGGAEVIDNLTSQSTNTGLSANQGRILNDTKLNKDHDDVCHGYILFKKGLTSRGDIKGGGFNDNGNVGIGAAIFLNNNEWNVIGDTLISRKGFSTDDNKSSLSKNENGEWDLKVDNLIVKKTVFNEIVDKSTGLILAMQNFTDDSYAYDQISANCDIVIMDRGLTLSKTLTLPKTEPGKLYMIRNNSNVAHFLQTRKMSNELIENVNGTNADKMYEIRAHSNVLIIRVDDFTWDVFYEG